MISAARPANKARMVSVIAPKARAVRPSVAAHFQITFITPDGEMKVEVPPDETIAEVANEAGVNIPVSCSAGSCSTCAGIIKSGEVNQDDQTFLDEDQIDAGFVLTCVAFAESDCVIETNKEEELY